MRRSGYVNAPTVARLIGLSMNVFRCNARTVREIAPIVVWYGTLAIIAALGQ